MDRPIESGPSTVSVVLPTMNEEGNVGALCEKLHELREQHEHVTEAIFVLNNTTDGTESVLQDISKRSGYQFVRIAHSKGARGSAIRKGVEISKGNIIVVVDSDGQYDPRELPKLVRPITDQGYYVVVGRNHASASLLRRLISEVFKKLTKILLGVGYVQTGFKAGIRQVLLETIPDDVPGLDIDVRWMNNIVTKGYGPKLSQDVDVRVYPRMQGRTTFSPIRLALGLLYTTIGLFIQRKTGRQLPFPRILKNITLFPKNST
ncbi:MAG: glycosyltransferase family 2 protein [archaeon]